MDTPQKMRLLVEGRDDLFAIAELLKRNQIDLDSLNVSEWLIEDCKSYPKLQRIVPVAVKTYDRLGIVIDANGDFEARVQSIRSALVRAGVPAVPDMTPDGIDFSGFLSGSRIGLWIMPDNQSNGMLEDFLQVLVPAGDACWEHAVSATAEAKRRGANFADIHTRKAEVHTWLAWQEEPGIPFGTAVKAKYFTADHELAQRFVRWFQRLFIDA